MKTLTLNLYTFNELSTEAQEVAIKNYANIGYEDFNASERESSYKKAEAIYKELHSIEGTISGARLYTWIRNNIVSDFDKRNFISKHTDGTFKNSAWEYKYDCVKYRVSKVFTSNDFEECPLTGVAYDIDFLQPIYDFLKNPDKYTTNEDLTIPDYGDVWQRDYDYYTSEEAIREQLENTENEYLETGEEY